MTAQERTAQERTAQERTAQERTAQERTAQERTAQERTALFTEAMAQLVSGLAVVTTRRYDQPCGLLVSSLCSYSVDPPSVLVAIGRASRSHEALIRCAEFGVHLLGGADDRIATVFASRGEDKFAGVTWHWDGAIPRLPDVPVFLACARRRVFAYGDHSIVIGEMTAGDLRGGDPLVYYRRQLTWRLDSPALTHLPR